MYQAVQEFADSHCPWGQFVREGINVLIVSGDLSLRQPFMEKNYEVTMIDSSLPDQPEGKFWLIVLDVKEFDIEFLQEAARLLRRPQRMLVLNNSKEVEALVDKCRLEIVKRSDLAIWLRHRRSARQF